MQVASRVGEQCKCMGWDAARCFIKGPVLWRCDRFLIFFHKCWPNNRQITWIAFELLDKCLKHGLALEMMPFCKVAGGRVLLSVLWRASFSDAFPGSEYSSIKTKHTTLEMTHNGETTWNKYKQFVLLTEFRFDLLSAVLGKQVQNILKFYILYYCNNRN